MKSLSRHTLPVDDRRLLDRFQDVRQMFANRNRQEAERLLHDLEQLFADRLIHTHAQLSAMADSNARAVEFMDRMTNLAEELRLQNEQLKAQNLELEATQRELDSQARAMAEANVAACLMVEESSATVESLAKQKQELASTTDDLTRLKKDLEEQAAALAVANVEAIGMVEEKETIIHQLTERVQESEQDHNALREAAFIDEMTKLYNYRYFKEQIRLETARFHRYGRSFSLLFLDLDLFKHFNDHYGHLIGDHVLREVATLVQASSRICDISARIDQRTFAARYGGEEFVVILPESPLEGGRILAERIRRRVEETTFVSPDGALLEHITISIGVACISKGEDATNLIRRADEALYRAKANGRNRVELDGIIDVTTSLGAS